MNIIISGYGKMGHAIEEMARSQDITCLASSNDIRSVPKELAAQAVCIDFSTPSAFRDNYRYLARHFQGVVVGTTGWDEIRDEVFEAFRQTDTPLIYAANFSIGVNLLYEITHRLCQQLKKIGGYQPSITETHHIHKLDAPSGTAKTLAHLIEESLMQSVPVTSVRLAETPGTHCLSFTSESDRITLTHEAFSRKGFAEGALWAARQIPHLKGIHTFDSLLFQNPPTP